MNKVIQSGCIQTILSNGKLVKYRITLWVPEWYAIEHPKNVEKMGKKYLYCPEDVNYDRLTYQLNAAQCIIYQRKAQEAENKWLAKFNEIALYQSKNN